MTGYSIIVNGSGRKFIGQFMVQKIIKTRTRDDEFREILIKFGLRVSIKIPILISLTRWQ